MKYLKKSLGLSRLFPSDTREKTEWTRVFIFAFVVFAIACSCNVHAQFEPKESSKLDIQVLASDDVNPDDKGRAAPIMIRIYELKSEAPFLEADYFTLYNQDKATLGNDMLVREEFILRPGEIHAIKRKSHPDTAALGVMAGYKDLPNAHWRAVHKLPPAPEAGWYRFAVPATKIKLKVDLTKQAIRITESD